MTKTNNSNTQDLAKKKITKQTILFSKIKRRFLKHIWLARITVLGVTLVIFGLILILVLSLLSRTRLAFYYSVARSFILTPAEQIKSVEDRTNILILGKGGATHEAPDLTDTIIFASISHSDPQIDLISIPRDIWIPALRTKLNSVYYWGNQKELGGGLVLAKSSVEEIVGQPIAYAVVIDFSGFKDVIDALESVEVEVENSFVDERYPIPGKEADLCGGDPEYRCRYETIRFERGLQTMDGDRALKFVRSRNAEGDEGTDLARAVRQEKVMAAVKAKLTSRQVLLSPKKLSTLVSIGQKAIETDIDPNAAAIIARRLLQAKDKITTNVLAEELLVNPPKSPQYDNLYVFLPEAGDWSEVHKWILEQID
jgi:LCP family protein required for cell wall assembly